MLNSFRSKGRGTGTNIVVWALLGLLMVGLTGLGLGGAVSSLSGQNVASIDGEPVPRDAFVRQLFRQLDAFGQQTGQRPTVQQARAFGLDQQVLTQLIGRAAVDAQARGMGLSVPDTMVRDALIENPSFSGLSGGFDAESYEFFLNRQGMTAREFEEELRADLTRALVQAGVSGGLAMPRAGAEAILAWQGEQRSIRAVEFTREGLEPPADPDDATLMAYWEEHPELYTLPETRIVSYVVLRPDDLAGEIEIGEDALRAAYDARADSYDQPERRMVDVIGFADMAAAEAAKAAIEAGETTFGDIASVRGLSAADLSLGAVARGGVASGARDAVFGLEEPGVAGPAMGDLGPSLFRVNAILPARSTSFEEAREDLATELAAVEAAQDLIGWYEPVEDLLAGGATLEEIAEETPLAFGEIGLTEAPGEGLAGDANFRREAFDAEPGEERDVIDLTSGGLAAVRVERVEPPTVSPFDEVRATVLEDWREDQILATLVAQAEALEAQIEEGRTLQASAEAEGYTVLEAGPITRSGALGPEFPTGAIATLFEQDAGAASVITDLGAAYLIQTAEVRPAEGETEAFETAVTALRQQMSAGAAGGLLTGYTQMLIAAGQPTVNQDLIGLTLDQYP